MSPPGYTQPSQPVTGHVRYTADSGRQGRRCPLSRGLGRFTLSSRHGGQVAWKAVPDPRETFAFGPGDVSSGGKRTSGYWSRRRCGAQIVSNLTSAQWRFKLF